MKGFSRAAQQTLISSPDGTFRAHLRVGSEGVEPGGFSGRWLVRRGLVVAATSVTARP